MLYDRDSFLTGVAVGRNLQGWPRLDFALYAPLIFVIRITSTTFRLYNVIWKGYKGIISWGDGTETDYTETPLSVYSITHEYPEAGRYIISIRFSNDCPLYDDTKTLFPPSLVGMFQGVGSTLLSVLTPFPTVYSTVTNAKQMFCQCTNLIGFPATLFINTPNITNITGLFEGCTALASVPDGLFTNNTRINQAPYAFDRCSSLVSIPADLFYGLDIYDFSYCFYGCYSLTAIPDGLFDTCTNAYSFISCFDGCSAIREIPIGLFEKTKAQSMERCFANCVAVTEIPDSLFAGLSEITSFKGCFAGCSGVTEIPSMLFLDCPNVTTFEQCFYYCTNLVSVPEDLFVHCPNASNFRECFVWDFKIVSNVPELWITHPNADGYHCYSACTNAANYADIPSGWK